MENEIKRLPVGEKIWARRGSCQETMGVESEQLAPKPSVLGSKETTPDARVMGVERDILAVTLGSRNLINTRMARCQKSVNSHPCPAPGALA